MDMLCGGILQAGFQYLVNISYVHNMVIFDGAYVYQQIVKGRS